MRMQIVDEKKQSDFAARAEHNRLRSTIPVLPVAEALPTYDHAASCRESRGDSPVEAQKFAIGFSTNFQSASEYSGDSRKSNASPVLRRPSTAKAFNFGSPAAHHSDDEEDIIDAALYRTVCFKKLAEAEVPIPDKKVLRRYSQLGRSSLSTSPASPLSPQLKSVSMRPMQPVPTAPAPTDGMRGLSIESIQTKIFQPSPLPGRVLESSSDEPVRTNSDSFMALAGRAVLPHIESPVSTPTVIQGLQNASERPGSNQSHNLSKKNSPAKSNYDWLRNYKCSMRKCVSPITEGWKRPDGGSAQSGRMMAIFETGFYIVGITFET